jgi:hypothetical protein
MKTSYALVGLAALLTAGSANASLLPGNAIYSSFVTNSPDQAPNPDFPLTTGAVSLAGSPLAQQFDVTGPTTLASLGFRLSDATAATDGGSILVYLVPSNLAGTLPLTTLTANQLAATTLLATISDSSLPVNGVGGCVFGGISATINTCNTMVSVNDSISTPGDYWIALVNGSDTNNGGTNPNSSGALWWRSGDNIGLNAAGLTNAHVNTSDVLTSQVSPPNAFEMQVNTAEPASLALLGVGMTGLGFARRRWTKKSAG